MVILECTLLSLQVKRDSFESGNLLGMSPDLQAGRRVARECTAPPRAALRKRYQDARCGLAGVCATGCMARALRQAGGAPA
jgi:hypothetical protein